MMASPAKFNWSLQYRLYTWLAVGLGVTLGLMFGVIMPSLGRLEAQTAYIVKTLSDNTLSDTAATNIIHAKQDEVSLQYDLTQLRTAFIQEQNPLPYLTQLETLADERAVILDFDVNETSDATVGKGQVKPIITTIQVSGSWLNVLDFINDVMVEPIYFVTDKVEFGVVGEQSTDVTATLTGKTYWQ